MNDDRLFSALQRLGSEQLPAASDRAIRRRLETAWTARAGAIRVHGLAFRRVAPVLASVALVAGLGGSTLAAAADSPLWDTRVAVEEAGVFLRQSPDDRVAYLLSLVRSRTEEAARQEAAGHPAAAAKARAASASAVAALGATLPRIENAVVTPAPGTPPPTNSPSSSASPSALVVPAVQPSPSASPSPVRTSAPPAPTATPLRTEPVHTPTPTPTATKTAITIIGTVKDATGTTVNGACISTSATVPTSTTQCAVKTTTNGSYGISTTSATVGQSITLYAYWLNATGQMYSGSATGTIAAPTTVMPTIALTLRR